MYLAVILRACVVSFPRTFSLKMLSNRKNLMNNLLSINCKTQPATNQVNVDNHRTL